MVRCWLSSFCPLLHGSAPGVTPCPIQQYHPAILYEVFPSCQRPIRGKGRASMALVNLLAYDFNHVLFLLSVHLHSSDKPSSYYVIVGLKKWGINPFLHWRRLVRNIGCANQNIGRQKVVKSDKYMGVSKLLGGMCPGCHP